MIDAYSVCLICHNEAVLECMECNLDFLDDCYCIFQDSLETIDVYCHNCNTKTTVDLDEFVDAVYGYNDQEDDEFDIYEYLTEEDMGKKKNKKKEKKLIGYDIFRKCRHY